MRLKSFTGSTLPEVRNIIRRELGEDAQVATTKDLGSEGYQIVCVLPDADDTETNYGNASSQFIQALRWHRTPMGLSQRLGQLIEDDQSLELAISNAFTKIKNIVPIEKNKGLESICQAGKMVMLVGTPGSGKTVMAAKLAVFALLKGINVALLGCDQLRQAAMEQLRAYADRLHCAFYEAPTGRIQFLALISRLQHQKTLVIADTMGCNPFLREELLQLTRLASPEQIQKILVMSSITDRHSSILLASEFQALNVSGIIGTGLDFESRIGSLLAASDQLSQPLLAWSQTSRVNESVITSSSSALAQYIIRTTPEAAYHVEENIVKLKSNDENNTATKASLEQGRFNNEGNIGFPTPSFSDSKKQETPQTRLEDYDFSDISLANNLVTIGSGKGGVGKTWFTITLAQALARLNKRVLVFDGDLGLANIDIQLGITPDKDLAGVIQGKFTLRECIIPYKAGKFDVIVGRSGSGTLSMASPRQIHAILAELVKVGSSYDYVLLDLGAGIDPIVRLFSYYGRVVLLLTTEDPTSIADTYAFIKILLAKRSRANIHIVMNLVESLISGTRGFETLSRAVEKFLNNEVPLAGLIQRDRAVIDAIRHQSALLTRSPLSLSARSVVEIATSMVNGKLHVNLDSEASEPTAVL